MQFHNLSCHSFFLNVNCELLESDAFACKTFEITNHKSNNDNLASEVVLIFGLNFTKGPRQRIHRKKKIFIPSALR